MVSGCITSDFIFYIFVMRISPSLSFKALFNFLSVSVTSLLVLLLISCGSGSGLTPIRNLSSVPVERIKTTVKQYSVRKTDTLYSIAFRFGIDFMQLVKINGFKSPFTIYPGQIVYLRPFKESATRLQEPTVFRSKPDKQQGLTNIKKESIVARQQNENTSNINLNTNSQGLGKKLNFDQKKKMTAWQWPVKNMSWKKFSSWKEGLQGINISGRLGEPVWAAAAGQVVYSGNGLVGYGNLIIIKHNQFYLSAYAYNDKLIVGEGDLVTTGQKIATMGKNDTGQTQLRFEIRYRGRPVNPLKYLPPSD